MREIKTFDGIAGPTFTQVSSDTAQTITAANLVDSSTNRRARGAIISVEDNGIRYAFNTDAVQAANGPGHLAATNSTIVLASGNMVHKFSFINSTNGSNAALQISPLF